MSALKTGAISLALLLLFVLNISIGSVSIPPAEILSILSGAPCSNASWQYIIMESRLPGAVTALLCGGALAASGLLLQTAFRNPLAGPSVFGINSGASLGVALVMLLMGGNIAVSSVSIGGFMAVLVAAFIGAAAVMGVLLFFSTIVRSNVMLLIVGIMIGYISSSAIALLNYMATQEGVQSYMVWGLGSFGGVTSDMLPLFCTITLIGIVASLLLIKPLNALLLGEQYAQNIGVNTRMVRNILLIVTGLLTAITTAFCGPIAFIGLAVPHIARMVTRTDNHLYLMPTTIVIGSMMALACNIICVLPGENGIIPLNAVTPMMGAPVIIYVLVKKRY